MYSLYRAWFEETSYPRLMETLSPPDTVVRVGNDAEYHFVAHRSVLAAHSGYLKALLTAEATQESSTGTPVVASITVPPTIAGGEAFAPLLNYMYTGRLEVTLDNIYTVLLATHLLHMPGALEQCRAALMRLRPPTSSSPPPATTSSQPSILRPVPNRLLGPAFCWPQYPPRHLELPHLPSLSLLPSPLIHKTAASSYKNKEASMSPSSSHRASSNSPELVVASSSTSPVITNQQPTRNPSPSSERAVSLSDGGSERTSQPPQAKRTKTSGGSRQRQNSSKSHIEPTASSSNTATLPGVVYDVACCDGPVRFHRVLNENYAPNAAAAATPQQPARVQCGNDEPVNDENDQSSSPTNNNPDNRTYTCGYCRHTFKSQYCYRKHARRHLLPAERPPTPPPPPPPPPPPASDSKKREVRLLDLNVQYYPCKICGSKFPSYYFVHKHRKLCHANVDDQSRSEEASKQQQQQQQPGTSENSNAQPA